MIALLLALSLSPAPSANAVPMEPAALTHPSVPDPDANEAQLAQLHLLFERSCGQRAYGTFDQVCETLSDQIRTVQRNANRAAKRPHVKVEPSVGP